MLGRPTNYKPEYCELLIEHMRQGLSFESFAGVVGSTKKTLYSWTEKFPDFLNAKEMGTGLSQVFWENLGVKHILNETESQHGVGSSSKSLNASVWIFNMKNRFGWRDKQPDEVDVIVNNIAGKSDEELDQRIQELEKKIRS